MSEKQLRIGFDRYIDREWADYTLDLHLGDLDDTTNYTLLKEYLQKKISGVESARKTANQLKRLWLSNEHDSSSLSEAAKDILLSSSGNYRFLFHYGMALNSFPIFHEACKVIGELCFIYDKVDRQLIVNRLNEQYLNKTSIPRITLRIIQTLENWGLIYSDSRFVYLKNIELISNPCSSWLITSIIEVLPQKEIQFKQVSTLPELLGIKIMSIRENLDKTSNLFTRRNVYGEEVLFRRD